MQKQLDEMLSRISLTEIEKRRFKTQAADYFS